VVEPLVAPIGDGEGLAGAVSLVLVGAPGLLELPEAYAGSLQGLQRGEWGP